MSEECFSKVICNWLLLETAQTPSFELTVENDLGMEDSEIFGIADYILNNKAFLRQLMAIGFDTLIVQGKLTHRGKMFCMKRYSELKGYALNG